MEAGHSVEELLALVEKTPLWKEEDEKRDCRRREKREHETGGAETPKGYQYSQGRSGIVWHKPTKDGSLPVPLTNFQARIVADVIHDNGLEKTHSFELEAGKAGTSRRFVIPAGRFASMNWVIENLGPQAIVYAGWSNKDHTRAAIQVLSGEVETRTVYVHTGWTKIEDNGWYYLHAGGSIGTEGTETLVDTQLSSKLSRFLIPDPPECEQLHEAIQDSLALLDLAPRHITFPLFAGIWRAVLGEPDLSIHISGTTGVFKSELAALIQSFFGAAFDARNLPGAWSHTGNSLEELAFVAKDAIIVIDDFAPAGSSYDIQRYHKEADRVFRAQGNRSGRGRLRPDGSQKDVHPPRGLIVSTGEDIPAGQSLRARILVLEITNGDINPDDLTKCQKESRDGNYVSVMAGFLKWAAPQLDELRSRLKDRIPELRHEASREGQHRRTPSIVAELYAAAEVFVDFVVDSGALDDEKTKELKSTCWEALGKAAAAQELHQRSSEPTTVFLDLLSAAIASGEAHIANPDGEVPEDSKPEALGWRSFLLGSGDFEREQWRPQGARVGWIEGDDLYLNGEAAFKAAQRMGTDIDRISIGMKTLFRRLREAGLLASWDKTRGKNTVRVHLQGSRRSVLHLRASYVVERAQRAQEAQEPSLDQKKGSLGPESGARNNSPAHVSDPHFRPKESPEGDSEPVHGASGTKGPIGPVSQPYNTGVIESVSEENLEEVKEWTG